MTVRHNDLFLLCADRGEVYRTMQRGYQLAQTFFSIWYFALMLGVAWLLHDTDVLPAVFCVLSFERVLFHQGEMRAHNFTLHIIDWMRDKDV